MYRAYDELRQCICSNGHLDIFNSKMNTYSYKHNYDYRFSFFRYVPLHCY